MGCGLVRWGGTCSTSPCATGLAKALEVYQKNRGRSVKRMTPLARPFAAINVVGGKSRRCSSSSRTIEPGFDEGRSKAIEVLAAAGRAMSAEARIP